MRKLVKLDVFCEKQKQPVKTVEYIPSHNSEVRLYEKDLDKLWVFKGKHSMRKE
jgi:hypothetical protein